LFSLTIFLQLVPINVYDDDDDDDLYELWWRWTVEHTP